MFVGFIRLCCFSITGVGKSSLLLRFSDNMFSGKLFIGPFVKLFILNHVDINSTVLSDGILFIYRSSCFGSDFCCQMFRFAGLNDEAVGYF